jgi:hypothetical protein
MKKSALIILAVMIVIITYFFYKDSSNEKEIEFEFASDIHQDTIFLRPYSEYAIELIDLRQRQIQSNVWLKNLYFSYSDNEKNYSDTSKFVSLTLRSYLLNKSNKSHKIYKIDWVNTFLENHKGEQCRVLGNYVEASPFRTMLWTPNKANSIFFPFDSYQFNLEFEEQAEYDGVITNISPEKISIDCKIPNFSIQKISDTQFILTRSWTFRIITIIFIILILFYTAYLWVNKSKADILTQSIGLFTGVWSIRTIVSTNAPIFPTIIDYFTLLIFIALGLLLIIKSIEKDKDN